MQPRPDGPALIIGLGTEVLENGQSVFYGHICRLFDSLLVV